jgi:hypothetical protein
MYTNKYTERDIPDWVTNTQRGAVADDNLARGFMPLSSWIFGN